jgi:glycosyltransferase involved in cell wall biosynthesis
VNRLPHPRLRIAVWYNLPSGGAKRALWHQILGLLERGHHVEAWRPPLVHEEFLPIGELVPEHEVPLDFKREADGYWGRVRQHIVRQKLLMRAMVEHSRECGRQIGAGGFDLLFANTCRDYHAPFVGRYVDLPKLLYLQEPSRWLYEAGPSSPWAAPEGGASIKRRLRDRLDLRPNRVHVREERRNAAAFDRILVNSYFSRESLLRAYGLDSRVCYLGIDAELFRPLGRPRERFVLGVGTLGPSKNVALAIEAVAAMGEDRPPLVWIANIVDDLYLRQMHELAMSRGVDFRPQAMASDAELVETMNRASLLIYTSRLEPFGLVPLEANACELPVVAVPEGGVRETVRHEENGLLADSDPQALATAMRRVLDEPELARCLGRRGREIVERDWTWHDANDRLEKAIWETASSELER